VVDLTRLHGHRAGGDDEGRKGEDRKSFLCPRASLFFLEGVLRVDDDVVKNKGRVKSTKRSWCE
jgi:hypothetical protein